MDTQYFYSSRKLRIIARNYDQLGNGFSFREGHLITNPWAIAEYKADFDMALNGIGRGRWSGFNINRSFKNLRNYGRLQRIIIADIMGIQNGELARLGFYDISRLREYSYYLMVRFLNGDKEWDRLKK